MKQEVLKAPIDVAAGADVDHQIGDAGAVHVAFEEPVALIVLADAQLAGDEPD